MYPEQASTRPSGPMVKMYKINKMGFKEVITISEYFENARSKIGFKLYKLG